MLKKSTLILPAVFFAGIILFGGCVKKTVPENENQPQAPQADSQSQSQGTETAPTAKEMKIQESTDKITINVSYPELQNVSNAKAGSDVNRQLASDAEKRVENFKASVRDYSSPLPGAKSTLDVNYTTEYLSQNLASFDFVISAYIEGSAHPGNEISGFNYNLENGRIVALADIFDTKTNYLKMLSQKTFQNLKAQAPANSLFDDATLTEALSPKAQNFSDFVVEKDGLTIFPAPYSVAPYASGPQSVKLTFSEMKEYLNADFVQLVGASY